MLIKSIQLIVLKDRHGLKWIAYLNMLYEFDWNISVFTSRREYWLLQLSRCAFHSFLCQPFFLPWLFNRDGDVILYQFCKGVKYMLPHLNDTTCIDWDAKVSGNTETCFVFCCVCLELSVNGCGFDLLVFFFFLSSYG